MMTTRHLRWCGARQSMASLPPRRQLLGLCLLVVGLALCVSGIGGVTDPNGENTYSLETTGSSTYNFTELSADAQRVVENGSEAPDPITVETLPDEFSAARVTIVRYEGTRFCVRAKESRESAQVPTETPRENRTVVVKDCTGVVFDFKSLSSAGQAVVSETLDSPNNETTLSRELPPEFSAGYSDAPPAPGNAETLSADGIYYIIKDGTVYAFIISSGWLVLGDFFGGILLVVGGVALAAVGVYSYTRPEEQSADE
jgi:hypothetical protein